LRQLSKKLDDIKESTVNRIETKLRKTYREIVTEIDEEKANLKQLESEEKFPLSNPLKLPNGPDGKPIPYWLYKLHGLNRKFECEICGNQIYEGRRSFEKHFQETHHQQGMQALGIPNTKVFFEITKIKDGIKLWRSLSKEKEKDNRNIQEYEDSEGNVYDRETFRLLTKQGIL